MTNINIIKIDGAVASKIIEIRRQKVLLDSDVAVLYGVETKEINQAVKNNPDKFPNNYLIELEKSEKNELVKNFDRFIKLKHSTVVPKAFTERGLYMLATILKSPQATATTIAIVDTFTLVREINRTIIDVVKIPENQSKQKSLLEKAGKLIGKLVMPTDEDMEIVETETKHELSVLVGYKFTRINRMRPKKPENK